MQINIIYKINSLHLEKVRSSQHQKENQHYQYYNEYLGPAQNKIKTHTTKKKNNERAHNNWKCFFFKFKINSTINSQIGNQEEIH
jgi:hypothetical protein